MPIEDLRDWIRRVEELGELTRVEGADPETEIGALVDVFQWDMETPALLFEEIKGHATGHRVLANAFTSMKRVALSLNMPATLSRREFVAQWRKRMLELEPRAPVRVGSAPVLENVVTGDDVDLTRFPAPQWHPHDGRGYLGTGDLVITRDPETGWVNCGTYRVQVHDEKTAGIMIAPGKHGGMIRDRYWRRGEPCPVAVSLGHDPLLLMVGGLEIDYGVGEYDVAGGIRGEPIPIIDAPYTGLPIPATAEIVLEGEIPPDVTRAEGPFGEWTGYYAGGVREMPIINVKSIAFRNDPIVLACIPGKPPSDNTFFRSPLRGALIWEQLEKSGIPGIVGAWSHEAGGARFLNVIAIEQLYPGHSRQVGLAAASCPAGVQANRVVVVVDDDIDPTDTNEVLWALTTRADMVDDVEQIRRCRTTGPDPMAYAGDGDRPCYNNRMIIDACRPYDRLSTFPRTVRISHEEATAVRARWPELFGRDGRVRMPGKG
ncbi:MAG: UbiD family decarboxylase [Myxococcales bacterium]|nr:UbiD family decarboxylase [Myxococcales bacterium]